MGLLERLKLPRTGPRQRKQMLITSIEGTRAQPKPGISVADYRRQREGVLSADSKVGMTRVSAKSKIAS